MGNYSHLRGTGVALVTPFDADLNIDWDALQRLMDFTAENGSDYYVVMGTTGESATLNAEEKKAVLSFVKKNNKYNLPIVYGIGSYNTMEVIESIDAADLSGVEAILSVSPYYNKPSQEGIQAHFKAIADHSPVPVILYNVPGRTNSNMLHSSTLALAEHPNIIGVKEAAGDLQQIMRIAYQKPKDFLLICGDDMFTPALVASGGDGVISVIANGFPQAFKNLFEKAEQKDFKGASEEMMQFLNLNPLLYQESNPVGIKYVLEKLSICSSYVRLPLLPISDALKEKVDSVIATDKLL